MRRGIEKSIARYDSILARAADPMVCDALPGCKLDEFNAGPTEHQVPFGRLIPVAAMVTHPDCVLLAVRCTLLHNLARFQITGDSETRVARTHEIARPDQAIGDEDIYRRVVALAAIAAP